MLNPFKLIIKKYDFAAAYQLQYLVTEKELRITFISEVEGEKDSILFAKHLKTTPDLKKLSELNLDSLKDYYQNPCIDDGNQILVYLAKEDKKKSVHLSNYYHPEISPVIDLMNRIVPEKYRIYHDKEKLLKWLQECNG
ncbi:hypothetical protein GCM10023183_11790 [Nibribacter koreensis]|uniref:DUF695 domain-containing protein n=1 Tax=Nibribacter koreensis TaxID=1084519 RepID=A0ABP8FD96_9BACT